MSNPQTPTELLVDALRSGSVHLTALLSSSTPEELEAAARALLNITLPAPPHVSSATWKNALSGARARTWHGHSVATLISPEFNALLTPTHAYLSHHRQLSVTTGTVAGQLFELARNMRLAEQSFAEEAQSILQGRLNAASTSMQDLIPVQEFPNVTPLDLPPGINGDRYATQHYSAAAPVHGTYQYQGRTVHADAPAGQICLNVDVHGRLFLQAPQEQATISSSYATALNIQVAALLGAPQIDTLLKNPNLPSGHRHHLERLLNAPVQTPTVQAMFSYVDQGGSTTVSVTGPAEERTALLNAALWGYLHPYNPKQRRQYLQSLEYWSVGLSLHERHAAPHPAPPVYPAHHPLSVQVGRWIIQRSAY